MIDESKHTEDIDASRSEITEPHAEETLRNLKSTQDLQLKRTPGSKSNGYENIRDEEESHRKYHRQVN